MALGGRLRFGRRRPLAVEGRIDNGRHRGGVERTIKEAVDAVGHALRVLYREGVLHPEASDVALLNKVKNLLQLLREDIGQASAL